MLARRIASVFIVLGVVVLSACTSDAEHNPASGDSTGSSSVELRVGQINTSLQSLLEAADVLSELPYSIRWNSFFSGPEAIEAQNADSIDIAYMADTPPIFAQAAGVPVSIVAVTKAPNGAQNIAVLVNQQSPIDDAEGLRGKRVAVVPGTITQFLLVRVLADAQIPLDEVESVTLQAPDAMTALRRGDVDAAILVDPSAAAAVHAHKARVLLTGEGLVSGSNVFVATHAALEHSGKEVAIGDLLKRVKSALTWAQQHPEPWAEIYGEVNRLPVAVARDAVVRTATELVPIDRDRIADQQQQADAFRRLGLISSDLDVRAMFDQRYNELLFGE